MLNITPADIGKKFRRRDGEIVTISRFNSDIKDVFADGFWYTNQGIEVANQLEYDLISRVEDEPTKPKTFYVVNSACDKRFDTFESAQTHATYMANIDKEKYYILKAVSVTSRGEPVTMELV